MSFNPSSKSQQFEATRITLTSPKSYDDVLTALYASIGSSEAAWEWPKMMKGIARSEDKREYFTNSFDNTVGPHGFMIFQEFDHGSWIPIFSVGDGLKCKRIILGNPLIAITMLEHDVDAGMFVPVEILVRETKEGTNIFYNLPSGLITALNKDLELVKAAEALDAKLAELVKDVLS